MNSLIALLRAVNVGGTGKLPMADLREMAQNLGFSDARTYIQSGNLVFRAAVDPEEAKVALEKSLRAYAGKPIGVLVRTSAQMQSILAANPFSMAEPGKVGVVFLNSPPPSDATETAKGRVDEQIELGAQEIYVHYPSGMGRSKLRLAAMSEGTVRNINTIIKLVAIANEGV